MFWIIVLLENDCFKIQVEEIFCSRENLEGLLLHRETITLEELPNFHVILQACPTPRKFMPLQNNKLLLPVV